jgi:hypothetical protein
VTVHFRVFRVLTTGIPIISFLEEMIENILGNCLQVLGFKIVALKII